MNISQPVSNIGLRTGWRWMRRRLMSFRSFLTLVWGEWEEGESSSHYQETKEKIRQQGFPIGPLDPRIRCGSCSLVAGWSFITFGSYRFILVVGAGVIRCPVSVTQVQEHTSLSPTPLLHSIPNPVSNIVLICNVRNWLCSIPLPIHL